MTNQNIDRETVITAYHNVTQILKDKFPKMIKPKLEVINDKGNQAYGSLHKWGDGKISRLTINLYYFNHIEKGDKLFNFLGLNENNTMYDYLIETICHELAHIKHFNHRRPHTELTKLYFKEVMNIINLRTNGNEAAAASVVKEITTLKVLCEKYKIDPKKARKALRDHDITKPGSQWVWPQGIPTEVIKIIKR